MEPNVVWPSLVAPDPALGHDLAEIDAAIGMVVAGIASRVDLVGLAAAETVAEVGLAHAQAAGVRFAFDRTARGGIGLTIGPRADRKPSTP
jgi:hypothetical protein